MIRKGTRIVDSRAGSGLHPTIQVRAARHRGICALDSRARDAPWQSGPLAAIIRTMPKSARSPTGLLRSLEQTKATFGGDAPAKKLALLQALDGVRLPTAAA